MLRRSRSSRRGLRALVLFAVVFTLTLMSLPSRAALDAPINRENPRIVPIYFKSYGDGAFSGFLYSSRIVFSAAHSEYVFDENGKKIDRSSPELWIGRPNSNTMDKAGLAQVVKRIVSPDYRNNRGLLDDFVIYILDRDLVPNLESVPLLTPEIEAELIASKSKVQIHGYGEYKDRCTANQVPPCQRRELGSEDPRSLEVELVTLAEAEARTGLYSPQFAGHLILLNGKQGAGCNGDSGGSITTAYQGKLLYLGPVPNGNGTYACGGGVSHPSGGINYSSPIYRHLGILKEAELFVAALIEEEKKVAEKKAAEESSKSTLISKSTSKKSYMTCTKGKMVKRISTSKSKCPPGYKKK